MAGNPYLISPELLMEDGLVSEDRIRMIPDFPERRVDIASVLSWKPQLLKDAWKNFEQGVSSLDQEFERFCEHHSEWLEDFVLFSSLREVTGKKAWTEWNEGWKKREPSALSEVREQYADQIRFHRFIQFLFFRQWQLLRNYAHEKGVRLIGDLPIFVAHDSADVWTFPDWFELDERGRPLRVAGVPPDYFSTIGQHWGNSFFLWEQMEASGFYWWKLRLWMLFESVDLVRIDHFRGFDQYWAIPATDKNRKMCDQIRTCWKRYEKV